MRHTLRLHTVIIGHSDLENAEVDVRRVWGVFRPGVGYELVQPIFRLYSEAVSRDGITRDAELLERYHRARDAMKLQLVDGDSRPIKTSAIHIADYATDDSAHFRGSESLKSTDFNDSDPLKTITLDVLITDDEYWDRRLRQNPPAG